VHSLVRREPSAGSGDVRWDPARGEIDTSALAAGRFDAVIHLAGEPILGRWSADKRDAITSSRVRGTHTIASALAALDAGDRPAALIAASATGWYGDRGEELVTEQSPAGTGFLAEVATAWEAAADPARDAGIRTVHMRLGVVQSRAGGALKLQLTPFRLGVGGRMGSGRQWVPWVSLEELGRMFAFVLDTPTLAGPINCVGPTPCTNGEYTKALGRVLKRPTVLPVPVPLMRLALGSDLVTEMLLASQKVAPARLEGAGFEFADRTIEDALRSALARS
jgi:uncharacterized protein (TIGR01777 family)